MMARHRPPVRWQILGLEQDRVINWRVDFGSSLPVGLRHPLFRPATGHLLIDNVDGAYSGVQPLPPGRLPVHR